MIKITSPTTGEIREIPETKEYNGLPHTYAYTSAQKNYKRETDWYIFRYASTQSSQIGIQQPLILHANDTTGT